MMVGLTISMHFQQFEDLKVQLFSRRTMLPDPPKNPCRVVHLFRFRRDCPDFARESRIPIRFQSGHEYPDFEDSEQRNLFLLNYHNSCHKMNKLLNLDIQVNSEFQS